MGSPYATVAYHSLEGLTFALSSMAGDPSAVRIPKRAFGDGAYAMFAVPLRLKEEIATVA
jgi:hypothetical protein